MNYTYLAIFAALLFVYSTVARRLESSPVNGALVFVAVGALLGPAGLGVLQLDVNGDDLRGLAEITLALVLFTDAARANRRVLVQSWGTSARLLGVGLPLTIVLGAVAARPLFDGLGWIELAVLATMLAPTDAALGMAVVTNTDVPATTRESLGVESGLNDGICVPVLLVFLEVATRAGGERLPMTTVLRFFAEEIGIGALVGVSCTSIGIWLANTANARNWVSDTWMQFVVPFLAFVCFGTAQALGGSGFIACFLGGLVLCLHSTRRKQNVLHIGEGVGDTLSLVTWTIFGAVEVDSMVRGVTWQGIVYGLLSLTVVRMLPVYVSLAGTGIPRAEKLFMGWFGPRGLASIVFIVIVVAEQLPANDTLSMVVTCTVVMSVVGHGLTANPMAAGLARLLRRRAA